MNLVIDSANFYDPETYSDYNYLGGIWEDFKGAISSVAKGVASVVQPIAPTLAYEAITGRPRPPEQVVITAPPVEKPAIPSWVLPVAGVGIGVLLLTKFMKPSRRRR